MACTTPLALSSCHSYADQTDQAVMDVREREHCLTEVLLPCIPLPERHQRLHRHLPSSPYSYGAIYTPVEDIAEHRPRNEISTAVATKSSSVPSAILLLKGHFPFRFGGQLERAFSPPLSWTNEELCGNRSPTTRETCAASVPWQGLGYTLNVRQMVISTALSPKPTEKTSSLMRFNQIRRRTLCASASVVPLPSITSGRPT